jgi:hypothetical protein
MKRPLSAVARALLLAPLLLIACGSGRRTSPAPALDQPALVKLPPEVRLRKLHLVRPDLIQYPIYYEVYC